MGVVSGSSSLPYNDRTSSSSSSSTTGTSYGKNESYDATYPTSCTVVARYALSDAEASAKEETVSAPAFSLSLTKNSINIPIVPGSVLFTWGGHIFYDVMGSIYADKDPNTGVGTLRGTIDYLTGVVSLDVYDAGDNVVAVKSLAGRLGSQYVTEVNFRTAGNPLRSASFTLAGVTMHGIRFSVIADENGNLSGDYLKGFVDTETGIVTIGFGQLIDNLAEYAEEDWYNENLVDGSKVWKPEPVYADSLTYACVVYSYIPLSAALLGINPVRLPVDGRVPIVKAGDVVVIHNTQAFTIESAPAGGTIMTLPRAASSVEIYDSSDPAVRIPSSMYSFIENGETITFDSENNDFSGYTMPLVVMHKVEDQRLVSSTQINGQVILAQGVSHDYEAVGTLVSSALLFGDISAKAYNLFDQKTWTGEFLDSVSGDAATATFNSIDYSVVVDNSGAVDEDWALVFDSTTHFKIIGAQRGVIGDGYTTQDCQPINSVTGKRYWYIDYRAFGEGWISGNVLRFKTRSATGPVWACRTTLQGPETEPDDYFVIQPRGDAQ